MVLVWPITGQTPDADAHFYSAPVSVSPLLYRKLRIEISFEIPDLRVNVTHGSLKVTWRKASFCGGRGRGQDIRSASTLS